MGIFDKKLKQKIRESAIGIELLDSAFRKKCAINYDRWSKGQEFINKLVAWALISIFECRKHSEEKNLEITRTVRILPSKGSSVGLML